MIPIDFPERNLTLTAEGCKDLPCWHGPNQFISCWELTDEDLDILMRTKKLYLSVLGSGHPPVDIVAAFPFVDNSEFPELIEEKEQ